MRSITRRHLCLAALLLLTAMVTMWSLPGHAPLEPRRIAYVAASNGPVQLFPGHMASFLAILPDGSLWRWGRGGHGIMPTLHRPARVGRDTDWRYASLGDDTALAIRTNGTLWQWGYRRGADRSAAPEQIVSEEHWIMCSSYRTASRVRHASALRQDGTIWTWSHAVNVIEDMKSAVIPAVRMVQVGTESNWTSIADSRWETVAINEPGELWAFNGTDRANSGTDGGVANPRLRQTDGADWEEVRGLSLLASNRRGETFRLIGRPWLRPPGFDARPRRVPFTSRPNAVRMNEMYEIRRNGTLWQSPYSHPFNPVQTPPQWRQVTERTDWVNLWSSGTTCFGLTADNTLWYWGFDLEWQPTRTSTWTAAKNWILSKTGSPVIAPPARQPTVIPVDAAIPLLRIKVLKSADRTETVMHQSAGGT